MAHSILRLSAPFLLTAGLQAQTPQVTFLPGYGPSDVSGDGSVVVGDAPSGQYFEWTGGGPVDIGGATAGNGVGGTARISRDGAFVGGTEFNAGSGLFELSRYERSSGTWTNLGGIGGSSGSETSSGWDISADGLHVVGLGWVNAGTAHATQWSSGTGTFDLGSTVSGQSSRANAVNFDGSVVAGWQDGSGRNGAIWENGTQTLLQTPSGGLVGEASAVSDDGQWVVGIGTDATGNEGWRWSQASGAVGLGNLGLSGFPPPRGFATDITGDGSTIIGFDRPFGPALSGEGWIWTQAMGLVSLDDYLAGLGLVVDSDVRFALPLAISADGKTIVGLARSGFAATGFIVTLGDDCPSPSNYCASVPNSTGNSATISWSGSTLISANDFTITASDLPSTQNGIFFYGADQRQFPFGPGFLCVSSQNNPIFRLPIVASNASGEASYTLDYGNLPTGGDIVAGSTWNFQFWYRDPAAGAPAFNLTDGLVVTFCP